MSSLTSNYDLIAEVNNKQLFKTNLVELMYLHPLPYLECGVIRLEEDAARAFRSYWSPGKMSVVEDFMMMTLTAQNRITSISRLARGTTNSITVDIKTIAATAILVPATTNVLIAHNHPAGSIVPSQSDLRLTKTIGETLNLFGISLLDHLILTDQDYYSMAASGDMEELSLK